MRLILMGYRGCGKTTLGQALAERLDFRFIDLDDEVCRFFGDKTIKQIWDEFGESAFRKLECFRLSKLLSDDRMVLALGGGTVIFKNCRRTLATAERCLRLYLYCPPAELHRRVLADPKFTDTRPNRPDPRTGLAEITDHLARRDPIYRALADHVIDVSAGSIDQTVDQILPLVQ